MEELLGDKIWVNPWVVVPFVVFFTALLAYCINAFVVWAAGRILQRTPADFRDRINPLLERYLFPLLFVGGLLLIMDAAPFSEVVLGASRRLLILLAILLMVFFLAKATLIVLRSMEGRYSALANIGGPIEILTKILFVVAGGMILLDNLGVSLAPLLTTLGIGSLAVAIGLQDTLGNFFAGLYLKADRPIDVGHYVRLESGQEGIVDRIGWRSTQIRTLENSTVVVPNSKLAQTIITNFDLPGGSISLQIPVGVSYESDPDRVEQILVDEVKRAQGKVGGLLDDPEPFVRFIPGFGDRSLEFTLICRVGRFVDQFLVQHELRKRILKRLAQEGIPIFRR